MPVRINYIKPNLVYDFHICQVVAGPCVYVLFNETNYNKYNDLVF